MLVHKCTYGASLTLPGLSGWRNQFTLPPEVGAGCDCSACHLHVTLHVQCTMTSTAILGATWAHMLQHSCVVAISSWPQGHLLLGVIQSHTFLKLACSLCSFFFFSQGLGLASNSHLCSSCVPAVTCSVLSFYAAWYVMHMNYFVWNEECKWFFLLHDLSLSSYKWCLLMNAVLNFNVT